MAREIGYRPTDIKNRVQELVDKPVAGRVTITFEVAAPPGETEGNVTKTAEGGQGNALRMVERGYRWRAK